MNKLELLETWKAFPKLVKKFRATRYVNGLAKRIDKELREQARIDSEVAEMFAGEAFILRRI